MSKKNRQTTKRVQEMQAAQRAREQRRRNLTIGVIVIAVVAVVVGIYVAVQLNQNDTGDDVVAPASGGASDKFGVLRGDPDAPVQVVMYEDFQCPACKQMEGLIGDTLTKNVDDKTISVEYRPVAFLDGASSTDYSSRALSTAACVLDENGPEAYVTLHGLLFANQPAEGGAGLTDEELAGLAEQAGADKAAVQKCQQAGTFDDWGKAATEAWSKAGFTGTPTILVDGKQVEFTNSTPPTETIQNAIDAAAGN